jgi:outer membrane lipoprotein-sorting protein
VEPQQNPVFNPFAALLGKPATPNTLSAEQRAIVDRVNGYLSGMQTLAGKFIQIGPDGSRTQGDFVISKPGRVRFEYDDPSPIELIADGSSVVVRDRRLATQDVYPLSQTPVALPAVRTASTLRRTRTSLRFTPTTCSSPSWPRRRAALSEPAA